MYSIGILGLLISQIVKEHADSRGIQRLTKVRIKQSLNRLIMASGCSASPRSGAFPQSTIQRKTRQIGGAEEDRTPDLLRARQALSQLSYGPVFADPPCHDHGNAELGGSGPI